MKKTKEPLQNTKKGDAPKGNPDNPYFNQFDDEYWESLAGGKRRKVQKKPTMGVSGKSVFSINKIIRDKKSN